MRTQRYCQDLYRLDTYISFLVTVSQLTQVVVILVDTDVADIIHYIFLVFPTYGYVSHVHIEVHWIHMKKHLSYFLTQLDLIIRNSRWASLVMVTNNQLAGIRYSVRGIRQNLTMPVKTK